jgi:erythromycin esterase-like protein
MAISESELARLVSDHAHQLRADEITDYDALIDAIGDSRFVLIGEASHGTHEFYRERAQITKRLIAEKGFIAVAVEADFPDAYRINRYVRGTGNDIDAIDSLGGFKRFHLDVAKCGCPGFYRLAPLAQ